VKCIYDGAPKPAAREGCNHVPLANSTKQSPSSEANSFIASEEIRRLLWKSKFHCRIKTLNEAFERVEQFEHLGRTNVILPVGVYGCETWSLTLREEHRLRTFANRVLGEVFGAQEGQGNREVEKTT
jgi:hypothetical protein